MHIHTHTCIIYADPELIKWLATFPLLSYATMQMIFNFLYVSPTFPPSDLSIFTATTHSIPPSQNVASSNLKCTTGETKQGKEQAKLERARHCMESTSLLF